jgi:glycerol uptake facilitator protein
MNAYLFEFIGTAVLILFGNGVVANFVLQGTKGSSAGWVGIALGWGIAVFVGVYISADISGSHINPAVTIGLAIAEKFDWNLVPGYVAAQVLGAMFGSGLVWLTYKRQYDATTDEEAIRATFSTSPSIRDPYWNFMTEAIGTFVLVFAVFFIAGGDFSGEAISLGSLDALPVALLVMGIGFSLGGPTGYAINPARDFGPRIMHALLPVKKGVRGSDWGYAWIPIVAPLTGGALAAFVYNLLAI